MFCNTVNTPATASSPATAPYPTMTLFYYTERALCLPEILELILSFYLAADGWKTLFAAVQVNRLWRELGVRILWANPEATRYLLRVPEDQRPIYASQLLTMHIREIERCSTKFKNLEFSRLRELYVSPRSGDFTLLEPYCVPSLHSFKVFDSLMQDVSSVVLGYLHNCPQLKSIWTDMKIRDTQHLLDALKHLPLLQELKLWKCVGKGDISGDLLLHLAQSKHITTLKVPWSWAADAVKQVTIAKDEMRFTPFPALKSLKLLAPSTSAEGLVQLFGNLTSLDLKLSDSTMEALWSIARLTNLTRLSLSYKQKTFISAGAIVALAALSKLRTLIIKRHYPNPEYAVESDFSDEDCEKVASHWPDLRYVSLQMESANLSTKGLMSLARHCRVLECFRSSQEFDLEEILASGRDGDALFPRLEQLHLVRPMLSRGHVDTTRFAFYILSS